MGVRGFFSLEGTELCREAAKACPEEARKKLQKILLKYFSPMVTENTSGENMHGSGLVILVSSLFHMFQALR